jgi:hypothetical protein
VDINVRCFVTNRGLGNVVHMAHYQSLETSKVAKSELEEPQ